MVAPRGDQSFRVRRTTRRLLLAVAALVGLWGMPAMSATAAEPLFDWSATNPPPDSTNYTPAPFLYDGNVASVVSYLQTQSLAGGLLAVRIAAPISDATARAVFNNSGFKVNYVFADLEGPTFVTDTATLVAQVNGNSNSNFSAGAYVGNYAIATIANDPTLPPGSPGTPAADFRNSGASMSNPQLYPGDPSFRGMGNGPQPPNGNTTVTNSSTVTGGAFPNLRSSLFILPIERLSFAAQNNGGGPLIPYVTRFSNYGNTALYNDPIAGLPNGQQGFQPGVATTYLTAAQTTNQMISRNNFQAQMLHYRLRGATGYHLLVPGVVGYSDQLFEADAVAGFNYLNANTNYTSPATGSLNIGTYGYGASVVTPVSFGATVNINGQQMSVEDAGVIMSGVTNSNSKMALLISNLTDTSANIVLPSVIADVAVPSQDLLQALGGDSNNLFLFSQSAGAWKLDYSGLAFNTPGLSNESEVGIPEPASISVMAMGAIGLLCRWRRR